MKITFIIPIKGTPSSLQKDAEWIHVPRANDTIELEEGWCSFLVRDIDWSHDGKSVRVLFYSAEMEGQTQKDLIKLGWRRVP